ncbi:hypothetical protein [Crocosphaera sp. Alani8]|uniref:hypothetical protein n=1 Tax=Crocosphaera sp. Alani8 TaxID=3038952 RepID=UPI00313B4C62
MKIVDVFHFQSGYTVLVGPIEGHEELIRGCNVGLFVDGKSFQFLEINGELLSDAKHPEGYRAITTKQHLDLTSNFVKQHFCQLKGIYEKKE